MSVPASRILIFLFFASLICRSAFNSSVVSSESDKFFKSIFKSNISFNNNKRLLKLFEPDKLILQLIGNLGAII